MHIGVFINMKILQLFSLSPFFIAVLFSFSPLSPSFADWNGLDTIKVIQDEWECINFRNGFMEWNGKLLIDTGKTGIWMMELDENEEFQYIDSIFISDEYYEMRFINNDTLFWESNDSIGKLLLTPNGFGEEISFYNTNHVYMLCFDGTDYVAVNNENWIYRIVFDENSIHFADSILVESEANSDIWYFEYSESILAATTYNNNGNYITNIFALNDQGFVALDTLDILYEEWHEIPSLFNGHIYLQERTENGSYLKKIDPWTSTITDSLLLPGRAYATELYMNRLVLGTILPSSYTSTIITDLSTFEISGQYDLEFDEECMPFPFLENYILWREYISGTDNVLTKIYRIQSENEVSKVSLFYPNNWSVSDIIVDDTITYIANYNLGLKVVGNIDQTDMEILDHIVFDNPIMRLIKSGDMLFTDYGHNCFLFNCENNNELFVVDTLSIDPYDMEIYQDMFVFSVNGGVSIFSNDFQEQLSSIQISGPPTIELKSSFLYALCDSLHVYDLSNPANPVYCSSLFVGINPREFLVEGDSLFVTPGTNNQGISVYSIENPEFPTFLTNIEFCMDGTPFRANENLKKFNDIFLGTRPARYYSIFDLIQENVNVLGNIDTEYRQIFFPERTGNLYSIDHMKFYVMRENEFTSIDENYYKSLPTEQRYSIYPNPANVAPSVKFSLRNAGEVGFSLYNVLGQRVFCTSQTYPSGSHIYSLIGNMKDIASGTYYLGVEIGGQETVKKVTLLK